jgi:serine/threonine-protein kinase
MGQCDANSTSGSAPTVQISVVAGPHAGMVVTWRAGSYLVGRGPHSQLSLTHDLLASLEHCRIDINAHGCVLQDLGSRQGTVVNGSAVSRSWLRSGDSIRIGLSALSVSIATPAEPGATVSLKDDHGSAAIESHLKPAHSGDSREGFLDIPGYSITRRIGEGGMGIVYEAIRRQDGRRVAIKTIIPAPGAAQRSILLFRREMKILAELEHPRIVRFIESGEFAGQIYLVMEYVEVVDLAGLLRPLARDRQVEFYCGVICQILEALQHAHERKLVHRDVKPSNILVSREKRRFQAKLADFGLAKNFEMAGLSQLTADNELRGTPAFMPPEQLQSSRYVKPAVDVYSSAATLFYYLTGCAPKPATVKRKSLSQLTSLFSRSDSAAAPAIDMQPLHGCQGLPPGLGEIIQRGLALNPRQRIATAAAMRAALMSFTKAHVKE